MTSKVPPFQCCPSLTASASKLSLSWVVGSSPLYCQGNRARKSGPLPRCSAAKEPKVSVAEERPLEPLIINRRDRY